MNRAERNAIRKQQADERRALADSLRAARAEERRVRQEQEAREQARRDAAAAVRKERERESYRTMCRGLVMSKVRTAGGSLPLSRLAKDWPAAVPASSLDEAVETLTGMGELVMNVGALVGDAVLVIPASLSDPPAVDPAGPATPADPPALPDPPAPTDDNPSPALVAALSGG